MKRTQRTDVLHMYRQTGQTGIDVNGERTGTGVMAHNVTFKVFTTQKFLQALPGHSRLMCDKKKRLVEF